ncbi:hypothetical protein Lser_V15G30541 [Lactuca serriola]
MATTLILKRSTAASSHYTKIFKSIRSVSAIPCVQRSFNTNASQVSAYEDFHCSIDEDRSSGSSGFRRRDNDFFSVFPARSFSEIFNMMDQFMDTPFISASRGGGLGGRRGWYAKEDDNTMNLRFDMPGLDKENVKVSVEQNTLIIKAEEEKDSEDDEEARRRYSSRIDLPTDVYILDEIKAEMKNGVLKVVLPKVKTEERKDVFQVQVE